MLEVESVFEAGDTIRVYYNGNYDGKRLEHKFFSAWKYPGGELGIKIREEAIPKAGTSERRYGIVWRIYNSDDLILLRLFIHSLGTLEGEVTDRATVIVPYYPYSRQDRDQSGMARASHLLRHVLNSGGGTTISSDYWTYDLHSKVEQCWIISVRCIPYGLIQPGTCVVLPDKGAATKYLELFKEDIQDSKLNMMPDYITMSKCRDASTGNILSYHISELSSAKMGTAEGVQQFLVIDDICDGGRTFELVSEALDKINTSAKRLLYVTHGIFSKGLQTLMQKFDTIYTTDTYYQRSRGYETDYAGRFVVLPIPDLQEVV